jgi:hypothetical protein
MSKDENQKPVMITIDSLATRNANLPPVNSRGMSINTASMHFNAASAAYEDAQTMAFEEGLKKVTAYIRYGIFLREVLAAFRVLLGVEKFTRLPMTVIQMLDVIPLSDKKSREFSSRMFSDVEEIFKAISGEKYVETSPWNYTVEMMVNGISAVIRKRMITSAPDTLWLQDRKIFTKEVDVGEKTIHVNENGNFIEFFFSDVANGSIDGIHTAMEKLKEASCKKGKKLRVIIREDDIRPDANIFNATKADMKISQRIVEMSDEAEIRYSRLIKTN